MNTTKGNHTITKIILATVPELARLALLMILLFGIAAPGIAAPAPAGLGSFSGSETVISFNSIGNEVPIASQFVGQGVSFSGALFGMTNGGDTDLFPNSGGVIASNWLYEGGGFQGSTFTATFSSLQHRVGFYSETNIPDDMIICVLTDNAPQGPIQFDTATDGAFIGVEDPDGFNSVTISVTGPDNNFFAIDDFRFESVPEPGSLTLAGLAAAALWVYKGLRSSARDLVEACGIA